MLTLFYIIGTLMMAILLWLAIIGIFAVGVVVIMALCVWVWEWIFHG